MAKVIGKDPSATKRATCKECASVLEYTQGETFEKKYGYDYLGDYEVGRAIKCPECGKDVLVQR